MCGGVPATSGVASVVVTVVTAPVACAEVTVVVMVGMMAGWFGVWGEGSERDTAAYGGQWWGGTLLVLLRP